MSSVLRPVWFLDVDGVINSFPTPRQHHVDRFGEYQHAEVTGFNIWYSPVVVSFINDISRRGLAEVTWLTTWTTHARDHLAPALGLDQFSVIEDDSGSDDPSSSMWWKWLRVRESIGSSPRPFVWTDDDLNRHVRRLAEGLPAEGLLVTPQSAPGLDPEHMRKIRKFLED